VWSLCSFLRSQKRTKNLPLNSCVFPRSSAKAGAESKHSAYIPSFANHLGAAITGGITVLLTLVFILHLLWVRDASTTLSMTFYKSLRSSAVNKNLRGSNLINQF